MEFSDSVKFFKTTHDDLTYAVQFSIENKALTRFHKPFNTDFYITVAQWEEIVSRLEEIVEAVTGPNCQSSGEFTADEVLKVQFQFLSKKKSFINFKRLNFDYVPDWVLLARITRLRPAIVSLDDLERIVTIDVDPVPSQDRSDIDLFDNEMKNDPHRSPTPTRAPTPEYHSSPEEKPIETRNKTNRKDKTLDKSPPKAPEPEQYDPNPESNTVATRYKASRKDKQNSNPSQPVSHEKNPEYDPSPETNKTESRYKPSNKDKVLNNNKSAPEYSPRSMNPNADESGTKKLYTPMKIDQQNTEPSKQKKYDDLFGEMSSDEEKRTGLVMNKIHVTPHANSKERQDRKRRQLLPLSEHKDKSKNLRSHKKVKNDQPTLDSFVSHVPRDESPESASSKVTVRKPKPKKLKMGQTKLSEPTERERANPLLNFGEDKLEAMNNFLEKSKQEEINKEKRKKELKNYKLWNCNDLSREQLKAFVQNFSQRVHSIFAKHSNAHSSRVKKLNPVLMTTSNVLTENQLSFVCSEIENLRDVGDRGHKEDVLTETILPEFILHVFREKFNLSHDDAMERLRTQEECIELFNKDTSLL